MHAVYPVRPGENNEELRYSLRSLSNIPGIEQVWIVGHRPSWLKDVEFIPGNRFDNSHRNVYDNIALACSASDMPDRVLVMNDDFFITAPLDSAEVIHYRGRLTDHIRCRRVQRNRGWWYESLVATLIALHAYGIKHPISYELHVPLTVDREAMCDSLHRARYVTPENPPQWRTLYGNLHNIGGVRHSDGKAYRSGPVNRPFHSTDDRTWRYFANQLRDMFPQPSRYEVH